MTDKTDAVSLPVLDIEDAVANRYSGASQQAEAQLCCPIDYDARYLKVLPKELIERDYGCGDPSKYVREGETVLDLGSGGGKICYIASQVVGPKGKVLGVDMNDDMLELARTFQPEVSDKIGWDNVSFFKGRIQDLGLDLDVLESHLSAQPVASANDFLEAQRLADKLRREQPMIASDSVDVVVSNCVLNLVSPADRRQLFAEIFRVLRRHGRAVISDIVCDEPVPEHLQNDPKLWSGCISGAFVEHEFLRAFADAGFHGIRIVERAAEPWQVVEGIEFRSMTLEAYKGKQGPCLDQRQAVIYRGPWKSVTDDDGHTLRRGERMAVCGKTFGLYTTAPYASDILGIEPAEPVSADEAPPYNCRSNAVRSPQETKGGKQVSDSADCCGPSGCC
jgi:arsenite methyltransferase